ncbi:GroES-like protein [Trametopsis cervina]|nr:GroES-like protein [Trametopsis cervina]
MPTHKALVLPEKNGEYVINDVETPTPGPGELLVEVRATALNPVDWKIRLTGYFVKSFPCVLGTDSAGVVKAIGEGVTDFAVGDRVLHQGFFTQPQATFQQYSLVPAEIAAKIPANLTFEQAATVPLTLATASFGLYSPPKPIPDHGGAGFTPHWEEGGRGKYAGQPILILGGSSAVGQHTIQSAKLSGFSPIITTASKHNEEYLKAMGATHIIDRKVSLPEGLKAITSEPLKIVFDAIGDKATQEMGHDVLAPGGTLIIVIGCQIDESKRTKDKSVVVVFGSAHDPQQRALGVSMYSKMTELLEKGEIKPNNVEIVTGGLEGIPAALQKLQDGKVSACKLVAPL